MRSVRSGSGEQRRTVGTETRVGGKTWTYGRLEMYRRTDRCGNGGGGGRIVRTPRGLGEMCTARGVCVFTQVVGMSHVTSIAQFTACVCVICKEGEEEAAVCMLQVCTVRVSVTSWAAETGPADITNGINSESKRIKCGAPTLSRQQTTGGN